MLCKVEQSCYLNSKIFCATTIPLGYIQPVNKNPMVLFNNSIHRIYTVICILALINAPFTYKNDYVKNGTNTEYLSAFARLYGYIRFFYPNPGNTSFAWDDFAIYGVEEVSKVKSTNELVNTLNRIFLPIAPTIKIFTNENFREPDEANHVSSTGKSKLFWQHRGLGMKYRISNTYSSRIVKINSKQELENPLFSDYPKDAKYTGKLSNQLNLYCRFDLMLSEDIIEKRTSDRNTIKDLFELEKLFQAESNYEISNKSNRVAGIIICWNIFQHFYPYFDIIDVNWNTVLNESIDEAISSETEQDYYEALSKLLSYLQDGHGNVIRKDKSINSADFPFKVDWIEDEVVVVSSEQESTILPGDIILSVDDKNAKIIIDSLKYYISGSDQWKQYKSTTLFGLGEQGSYANIKYKREGNTFTTSLRRSNSVDVRSTEQHVKYLKDRICYVDLLNVSESELRDSLNMLSHANGIIFDLRGRPRNNIDFILSHLVDNNITSARWMIPLIVYPDREKIKNFDTSGRWDIKPKKPRLTNNVIFITDASAISYAESILGIVEFYNIGKIIGTNTAGTNGSINPFYIPGGYLIVWTGMKVLKHDLTQHHLLGITPDLYVYNNMEAVKEQRDVFIEKAIQVLEDN